MREFTTIIYTLTEYEILNFGSKHPTVFFADHKLIIFLFKQKSNPYHKFLRVQLVLLNFPNLHTVWTADKNLALPDTLSRNALVTRKTTVEKPPKNFFLAKKSRPEYKYAAKIDSGYKQINTLDYFTLYFVYQNSHYEVDSLGKISVKPILYSSWLKK